MCALLIQKFRDENELMDWLSLLVTGLESSKYPCLVFSARETGKSGFLVLASNPLLFCYLLLKNASILIMTLIFFKIYPFSLVISWPFSPQC